MDINNSYRESIVELLGYGRMVLPQSSAGANGRSALEIINGRFSTSMNWPILTYPGRKLNYEFMATEAAWILDGGNYLDTVVHSMAKYREYSDDGIFLKGAYGPQVVEQLPYVIDVLTKDQNSRQAVMTIWRQRPDTRSKDIPCTVALQFLIRDDQLSVIATMRSSDIFWGLPYDAFTFSCIGAFVASQISQVSLGNLYINAGSLHVYENHLDAVRRLVQNPPGPGQYKDHIAFDLALMRKAPRSLAMALREVAKDPVTSGVTMHPAAAFLHQRKSS